ncbi:MAG TPA: hypothetical protein VMV15_05750 [Candidatus Binataceae bacterium]|nr:hypothetical protein [Candidatus Binataceae bacterium]
MNRCLSERVLLMLHDGEELRRERQHLEQCADCDRRYRRLDDDLAGIVAVLNQPAPAQHWAPRVSGHQARMGFAFAALVAAFLCGRLTTGNVGGQPGASQPAAAPVMVALDSSASVSGALVTPASYALYVDDLLSPDDSDSNIDLPADNGAQDSDDF